MTAEDQQEKFADSHQGHRKANRRQCEEYDCCTSIKNDGEEAEVKAKIKAALAELEKKVIAQYPKLTINEIKTIVVEKKWMEEMEKRISTEMDNISHRLTQASRNWPNATKHRCQTWKVKSAGWSGK